MTLGPVFAIVLAVICLLVGLHAVVAAASRRAVLVSAVAHVVMALGMAAMFVPAVDPLPAPVWAGLFLVLGAWFGAESIRAGSLLGEPGHHVVGAAAMLFMLTAHSRHGETAGPAAAVDPAHAHHVAATAGSGTDLLATALALALTAWFLVDIVRRVAPARVDVAPDGELLPRDGAVHARRETVPQLVMSGAMAVMLLGMA